MYEVIFYPSTEEVVVKKDGEEVGRCESYELDVICAYLQVQWKEAEEE